MHASIAVSTGGPMRFNLSLCVRKSCMPHTATAVGTKHAAMRE